MSPEMLAPSLQDNDKLSMSRRSCTDILTSIEESDGHLLSGLQFCRHGSSEKFIDGGLRSHLVMASKS